MQKHVNLVVLVKSFPTLDDNLDPNSNEYLLAKFGFDTAENESLKVCLILFDFQVMGFNFHIGTPPAFARSCEGSAQSRAQRLAGSAAPLRAAHLLDPAAFSQAKLLEEPIVSIYLPSGNARIMHYLERRFLNASSK